MEGRSLDMNALGHKRQLQTAGPQSLVLDREGRDAYCVLGSFTYSIFA